MHVRNIKGDKKPEMWQYLPTKFPNTFLGIQEKHDQKENFNLFVNCEMRFMDQLMKWWRWIFDSMNLWAVKIFKHDHFFSQQIKSKEDL